MEHYFNKVKLYLLDLGFDITSSASEDGILVVSDETRGVQNLIFDCQGELLVMEQLIATLENQTLEQLKQLLQLNRKLVHGAFALDETGTKILFRDTLQLSNLDLNELEASINSLSLGLGEHAQFFMDLA